ncbi:WD repeat-containing protein 44-like [Lolium rigidum]|uniref:WD repeat-containing protein 44-like n=1 Tax=Lolium rigidum TaxID=89674 RepID=UPI001F5C36C1|nr:WD repeat-containing protein 44-like [Lolium rigidum]
MSVEDEVVGDEEDSEELFYESLDRILSSSASSTSASDDDAPRRSSRRAAYDAAALHLWTSQPAPIQERRHRLLHLMGLAGDPALARFDTPRSAHDSRSDPPANPPRTLSDAATPEEDPSCLIRNLDDGTQFAVREEAGLREVGTGRQLTVEEFELFIGRSPLVQELMRRQTITNSAPNSAPNSNSQSGASTPMERSSSGSSNGGARSRRRGSGWLRTIRCVAAYDASSDKAGRRSSSATDDSQEGAARHGPDRVKVRPYGKSGKDFGGLFMNQEIHGHRGSVWTIKFSPDGRYLATAGEDCVIHVWEVLQSGRMREIEDNGACNPLATMACDDEGEGSHSEKKALNNGRSASSDQLRVPAHVFALSDKPVITFAGHSDDVLDLCWSKSQYLLSSSMDKTVRLWHMSSTYCLKAFSHSDYVTCIQFNPVDDRYFISGSLDEKVRIWSIPKREIVDWVDLHEMITAACYTPDGQGALIGSHKGSCHVYDTSDNMLHYKKQIDLQLKKKKSSQKKITGFQFVPGSSSKVIITSADSRIRVADGFELLHKFKGFRNTSSQISACSAANGRYIISASEDSNVYIWRYSDDSKPSRKKNIISVTNTHERFHCESVTVAVAWPCTSARMTWRANSSKQDDLDCVSSNGHILDSGPAKEDGISAVQQQSNNSNHNGDRAYATWPEELMTKTKQSPKSNTSLPDEVDQALSESAWGLVIVTAGRDGRIRTFQNFGFPSITSI